MIGWAVRTWWYFAKLQFRAVVWLFSGKKKERNLKGSERTPLVP